MNESSTSEVLTSDCIRHLPIPFYGSVMGLCGLAIALGHVPGLPWSAVAGQGLLHATAVWFLVLTFADRFLKVPFYLSWWAYTFPVAALSLATFRYQAMTGIGGFGILGTVLVLALVVLTAVIVFRTARALIRGELCLPEI